MVDHLTTGDIEVWLASVAGISIYEFHSLFMVMATNRLAVRR